MFFGGVVSELNFSIEVGMVSFCHLVALLGIASALTSGEKRSSKFLE